MSSFRGAVIIPQPRGEHKLSTLELERPIVPDEVSPNTSPVSIVLNTQSIPIVVGAPHANDTLDSRYLR